MEHRIRDDYTRYHSGGSIRVVFLFQAPSVWPSWESVWEAMQVDSRFDVRIYLQPPALETAQVRGAKEFLQERGLIYEEYSFDLIRKFNPHLVFVQFPYDGSYHRPDALSLRLRRAGCRVVYIPYGIEISDTEAGHRDHFQTFVVENAWRIYASCQGMLTGYNAYCVNRHAVRVCGSPKFDGFAHRERYVVPARILDQAAGRKIVLWKLHFPKRVMQGGVACQVTPDTMEYLRFAKLLSTYQNDVFFIVMPHPKMLEGGMTSSDTKGNSDLVYQAKQLLSVVNEQPNAMLDISADYRPALYGADAIIVDRSALVVEAALTGNPVLLMKNGFYQEPWTPPVDKVVTALRHGTTVNDMEQFVQQVADGQASRGSAKQIAELNFPYQDGFCGERIKNDILKAMQLEEKEKRPRVVFYGLGIVFQYYMDEREWQQELYFKITALVDSNEDKWGKTYGRHDVLPPKQLLGLEYDVLVITSEQNYYDIKRYLLYGLHLDERRIWRLDEFLVWLEERKA
ncbi:MAG: hypothetical protein E7200_00370 [Selenomonas ruminantium]|nr:hypothetical protein [Selenomonas ruminantium]